MIRFGYSWPGRRPGTRRWVSYPWWLRPVTGLPSVLYWTFIGWWAVPGLLALLATLWISAQVLLLFAGGIAFTWQAVRSSPVRARIRYLRFGLVIPYGGR